MTKLPKDHGKVVDELIANPRRLLIAHVCFGIASAIGLWVRPGTFTPYLPGRLGMGGSPSVFIFVDTSIAWLPYVVAMLVARRMLSDRDDKAVYVYIALAAIVAIVSIGLYSNSFHISTAPTPILISIGAMLALVAIAVMCASIWPSDTASRAG
jgi:fucose permease